MIVKILSSASSFSGIKYNENKVNTGSAQLVAAENFGVLEMNAHNRQRHEYLQYLTAWSTNERGIIDKPQFHAVISCQGREKDVGELKDIAEQYLAKMGYINNPYLIYFHGDTDNNHVHIVSSRVDEYGFKIKDSFERRRSQAAIKEIMLQDVGYEMQQHVKKAMTYNFSSEAQFKMILEMQGVKVKEKDGAYQFIKYGGVAQQMNKALVADKIEAYQEPEERIKQLKALFIKYKPSLTPEQFSEFMKSKFGVEMIFHKANGKEAPYGYTIIDHAKGQVLKGSQVLKLSALLAAAPRADMLKAGAELIRTLSENGRLRYRGFKSELSKLGFDLSPSGEVKISGEDKPSFTISQDRMKQLMYNDRLSEAQKFAIHSRAEADIIARVMFIKKEDIASLGQLSQGVQQLQKLRPAVKAGELLGFGAAPYENNEKNGMSFFATLKTDKGEMTVWSKDLQRAIADGGAKIGDAVGLEHLGKVPVAVKVQVQDEAGNFIEKEIQAERNTWELKPLDESHYASIPSRQQAQQAISDKLNSLLAIGRDLCDIARDNNYAFAKKEGEVFLVDKNGHALYNMAELTDRKLDYSGANVIDLDKASRPEISRGMDYASGTFGEVASLLLYVLQSNTGGTESEERRKKKRRIE